MNEFLDQVETHIPGFPVWPEMPEDRVFLVLRALRDDLIVDSLSSWLRGPWGDRLAEILSILPSLGELKLSTAMAAKFAEYPRSTSQSQSSRIAWLDELPEAEVEVLDAAANDLVPEIELALERLGHQILSRPIEWDSGNRVLVSQPLLLVDARGASKASLAQVSCPIRVLDGDGIAWWASTVEVVGVLPRRRVGERSPLGSITVAITTVLAELHGLMREGWSISLASDDGTVNGILSRRELADWLYPFSGKSST